MRILMLGDVVGEQAVNALREKLSKIKALYACDMAVANGENAAGCGISKDHAMTLHYAGVDVITLGNHAFAKREIADFLDDNSFIIRPENISNKAAGRGIAYCEVKGKRVCVMNLMGRLFMDKPADDPFAAADRIIKEQQGKADIFVIDFHAEATSEKLAFAWYLDGRASVVVGTHTHVKTADAQILPKKTGYITDLGMCGVTQSVLGVEWQRSVEMFTTSMPVILKVATGEITISGCVFEVDDNTGECLCVEPIEIK